VAITQRGPNCSSGTGSVSNVSPAQVAVRLGESTKLSRSQNAVWFAVRRHLQMRPTPEPFVQR